MPASWTSSVAEYRRSTMTPSRKRAIKADFGGVEFLVAGLSSIVGFKRLADRPRDRNDLIGLEEIHGELPSEAIPGVDS